MTTEEIAEIRDRIKNGPPKGVGYRADVVALERIRTVVLLEIAYQLAKMNELAERAA